MLRIGLSKGKKKICFKETLAYCSECSPKGAEHHQICPIFLSAETCLVFLRNYSSNRTEATLTTWTKYLPGYLMLFGKAKSLPPCVAIHKMASLGFL